MILTSVRNITERKRFEEALRRSESGLTEAQRIDHIGNWEYNVARDQAYWSDEMYRIFGFVPQEFVPTYKAFLRLIHPDDRESVRKSVREALYEGEQYDIEYRIVRPDGEVRSIHTRYEVVHDETGRPVRSVGTLHDITERKALEERLEHQAFHDPLTDVPNRTLFMDRLEHALARAGRSKDSVAVMFLDLDNFKLMNDSLGHEVGDRLLVAAAERLQSCLRPGDTIARLGGDEFTILLENIGGESGATRVAERITEALRAPFAIAGQDLFVTSSIGIALSSPDRDRPADLLQEADLAQYQAKSSGKACYEVFDPGMKTHALERLELGNELRQALERGEFKLCYQPKVELATGRFAGVEALVRWEHPERGLVSPSKFIPIAEETGLILSIGRWVLEEACRQAHEWQEQYPGASLSMVCVNLSAKQLQHPRIVEDIARVLRETGLDPCRLCLEITESVVMEDAPSTITTLQELKDLGVCLAIDDFGTGYSSLSYLKRFPVDFVKIDRSFIEELREDAGDAAVVSGIVALAHTLGMRVIAEGVETTGQLAQLRELGCDLAQGNHFREPLPSEEIATLLANEASW
jgi:diguanylate cyclase (GGDEF)-like protein/PAS domain S-box-containing protein